MCSLEYFFILSGQKGQLPVRSITVCSLISRGRLARPGVIITYLFNKYAFLITYLHEVAHLTHFNKHKDNKSPHGTIWKKEFQKLMSPILKPDVFPNDLLAILIKHMQNPKASSQSDSQLVKALRKYDEESIQSQEYLENISVGDRFELNGKVFKKISIRRTRAVCLEEKSRRKYLIPQIAEVTGL